MTRREFIWVHGIDGNQAGVIGRDLIDLYVDTTLDQDERLVFDIPAAHPKAYLLAEDVEIRLRDRRFYISELTQQRRDTETTIHVEAPATWQRLGEVTHVGSVVVSDATVQSGGETILDGTGWTIDAARTPDTGSWSMETQDRTLLENVRTWAKITGTSAEFDTQARTVAFLATRGADIGLAFRKGRNLRSVVRRRTPPKVTALFPYGRDDLTIAGVNGGEPWLEDTSFYSAQGIDFDATSPDGRTYRQIYGKHRVVRDQSFLKEADLLAWAQAELATIAQSVQHVELDVIDISEITGVPEGISVGDRARAFDPDFDEEFTAVVTRLKKYPLQPWRNEIELSTSPLVVADPDAASARPQQSNEWVQFPGPVRADYRIRNDGSYIVARVPLRFRDGGRADFHLDLWVTGVGDGDLIVTVIDSENGDAQQFKQVVVPYTNGATTRAQLTWAAENLTGSKVYAVRVTTEASGGPSTSNGVNIDADAGVDDLTDEYEASFWIKAQGAVQETPTSTNSVRFDFTGAVQHWTVPDNVTGPIRIEAVGGGGQGSTVSRGSGSKVVASFASVVPGTVYDVFVAGFADKTGLDGSGNNQTGTYPNGGNGGDGGIPALDGAGGGGSSDVRPTGSGIASALVVAAGGGGRGNGGGNGGDGGFFSGENGGPGDGPAGGGGATQFAGGAGSGGGTAGTLGQGGTGETGTGGSGFEAGGGGGGGYYGGGGGSQDGQAGSGGGGGSGWAAAGFYDLELADGFNSGIDGYVEISWEAPTDI